MNNKKIAILSIILLLILSGAGNTLATPTPTNEKTHYNLEIDVDLIEHHLYYSQGEPIHLKGFVNNTGTTDYTGRFHCQIWIEKTDGTHVANVLDHTYTGLESGKKELLSPNEFFPTKAGWYKVIGKVTFDINQHNTDESLPFRVSIFHSTSTNIATQKISNIQYPPSTYIKEKTESPNYLETNAILWGWWWPDFPAHFEPFFEKTEIAEFECAATALSTADFNDDGLLDVILKWHNGPFDEDFEVTFTILYNAGDGADFTSEDVYTIDYARIHDLNAADYDNDGDIDLLFTYTESINGGKRNGTGWLLFNNGENQFNEKKQVFFHGYDPARKRINPYVTSADFDNDGNIDFLVGDNSGLVAFYKNDGSGNFTHTCTSDFDENRRISWGLDSGDFNGDGFLDFIVTERDDNNLSDGHIYVKYNDGSSTCFAHDNYSQIVPLAVWEDESFYTTMYPVASGCIRTLDYNTDGLLDIVYGGPTNLFLFIQQEDGRFLTTTIARLHATKNGLVDGFDFNNLFSGGITVGDFNNDNREDVIIGGSHAVIQCLHNTHTCIDITYPDRSCVIKDSVYTNQFFPLYFPLKYATAFITGNIIIKTQELEPLSKVEFYLDNKLVFTDEENPFEWEWNKFSFGRHTIKAQAYDLEDNPAGYDTTRIWKFQ